MEMILEYGEGIILSTKDALWISRNNTRLDDFVLTNKRLFCTYKKSNGLFKRAALERFDIYLKDILVTNGQAFVQQTKYEGFHCLQIQFAYGSEFFSFASAPKRVIQQWVYAINKTMGTTSIGYAVKPASISSMLSEAFTGLADTIMNVIDPEGFENFERINNEQNRYNSQNDFETQFSKEVDPEEINHRSSNAGNSQKFCENCGNMLSVDAKFCSSCGSQVNSIENRPKAEYVNNERETYTERQEEYIGKVYKCPNCGNTVSLSDTACEACGYRLSGKSAVHSVVVFQEKLMRLEMERNNLNFNKKKSSEVLDTVDKEVISLVRTYPVPNSIEDIVEFFYLAIANIDINKSKRTLLNSDHIADASREREISNAWVGKLQSIYAKAEFYFPDEPEFAKIKEEYDSMMTKLKMK